MRKVDLAEDTSSKSKFKKWAGFLWPIGGTIFGLLFVPVAIAQYPAFFNENQWLLPGSVAAVGLCWLIPLVFHDRMRRLYRYIAGLDGGGIAVALLVAVSIIVLGYVGAARLLHFHQGHLRAALAATHRQTQNGLGSTSSQAETVPKKQPPHTTPKSTVQPRLTTKDFSVAFCGHPLELFDRNKRPVWSDQNDGPQECNLVVANNSVLPLPNGTIEVKIFADADMFISGVTSLPSCNYDATMSLGRDVCRVKIDITLTKYSGPFVVRFELPHRTVRYEAWFSVLPDGQAALGPWAMEMIPLHDD